jgi:pseudouridine-5'-phosphate glycosidase
VEYLETQGVSVISLGADEFPAFFTRHSGCKAPMRLETPEEIAKLIQSNYEMNLQSGMMVGVPIPVDEEV